MPTERTFTETEVRNTLLRLMGELIGFPFPQICVHLGACNILNEMERLGIELPPSEVGKAIAGANDGVSLKWIREQLGN